MFKDVDRIFVSGGLLNYGSQPKVQAFRDHGEWVELLWSTSDLPDVVVRKIGRIGGWSTQPIYASDKLYVGGGGEDHDYFGAYNRLYILDVNRSPSEEGFVLDWIEGCGNSPVVIHDSIYSIGPNALMKFYQPRDSMQ